jgi:hypothetical protein
MITDQDRSLRAHGVEHRTKIVGAKVEIGYLSYSIGQADPSLVERDDAGEMSEAPQERF